MDLSNYVDSKGAIDTPNYFKALADYFCIDVETVQTLSSNVQVENYLSVLIDKIETYVGGFGK